MVFSVNTNLNKLETVLELRHISKSFNGLKVLEDVSFSLQQGTITSLFGENGSGKTTLFHIVSGFMKANSGEVLFKGADLNGNSSVEISRLGVGRVWQTPRICKNLSVLDNLILASKNHPGETLFNYLIKPRLIWQEEKSRKARAATISEDIGLAGKLQKTAGSLSFGQQKLLSVGMLLMNDCELLLMDEPFAGVNGMMIDHISEVLLGLKNQGKTICIIEHNRTKAKAISNNTLTLVKGVIEQTDKLNA
jgi:neutral amino acid transport system ATP-binding protein